MRKLKKIFELYIYFGFPNFWFEFCLWPDKSIRSLYMRNGFSLIFYHPVKSSPFIKRERESLYSIIKRIELQRRFKDRIFLHYFIKLFYNGENAFPLLYKQYSNKEKFLIVWEKDQTERFINHPPLIKFKKKKKTLIEWVGRWTNLIHLHIISKKNEPVFFFGGTSISFLVESEPVFLISLKKY